MFTHALLLCVFSTALFSQQDKVAFEVHATGFPKNRAFKVGLRLKYTALDAQRMKKEGRNVPTKADIVLEQLSSNKFFWDVTFDDKGKARIKGSP
jgi:hypothetical protein